MIDDPADPEYKATVDRLQRSLRAYFKGRPLDGSAVRGMAELAREYRRRARERDIDLPEMRALVVPRLGAVQIVRADHDLAGIRTQLVNFVVRHPSMLPEEAAQALRWAFPDVKPDDLIDEARERAPQLRRYVTAAPPRAT